MNQNTPAHTSKPDKNPATSIPHHHHYPYSNITTATSFIHSSQAEESTTTIKSTTHANALFSGSLARSRGVGGGGDGGQSTHFTSISSNRSHKDNATTRSCNQNNKSAPKTVTTATSPSSDCWQRWWSSWWCQLRPSTTACVTFLLLSTTCSLCSASLCDPQSWWDPYKDKCIPCTVCQGDMIPLRPCQMHRDTVCGSIYDLKIDWVVLAKTEPNWKERRKFDGSDYGLDHHQLTAEQLQQLQDEADPLDWQTAALFLAVLACLLFFIVAACILVHHMRQWRRMERRLDQDVEELSTKLMAKLAEVQSLEGGTFFIGNADALRIPPSATTLTAGTGFHQPQHVMLPEKSDKHHNHLQANHLHHHHHNQQQQQHHHLHPHDRRIFNTTTIKSGNVYIEDGNGTGSKC
uniref:TNFR-Cys domain-containing protein n=1 Tax=Stomoxys calcitrans TaxID=35570 RepID=A0A1I8PDW4_STOCA